MVKQGTDLARPLVRSASRKELWHQIDLLAYRQNGSCECEDFEIRHKPELQRGATPGPSTRCKHIEEARADLLTRALNQISKTLPHHEPAA